MKTGNLTQNRARNDPINRQMHGYSLCNFEDEDGIQDVISPYSLDQFLISNTPRMQKVSRRQRNQKTLRLWCLDNSISLENPRVSFRREDHLDL